MKRIVVAALSLAAFAASGCASTPRSAPSLGIDLAQARAPKKWDPNGIEATLDPRKPGDFVVFRISGSFRDSVATLTERIVEREGAIVVIDYTLIEPGRAPETLRVSYDLVSDVFDVVVITKHGPRPAPAGAYELMRAKTMLTADGNDGLLYVEPITLALEGRPLLAERASWLISIGTEKATLRVTDSEAFAWGTLEGEIRTMDGHVVYRAELLEMGESDPSKPIFMAAAD
jgi:hypothetical protein